ncbi:hypothetical protein T4E_2324, partial [Trichinella pseudospiralis]
LFECIAQINIMDIQNNNSQSEYLNDTWPWQSQHDEALLTVLLYFLFGFLAVFSNITLLRILYRLKNVQNDYMSLRALAIGCIIYGAAFIYIAVYRSVILYCKPLSISISVCIIYVPFFIGGDTACACSVLLISVERFLAATTVDLYKKLQSPKWRRIAIITLCIFPMADLVYSCTSTTHTLNEITSPFCFTEDFMPNVYYDFHLTLVLSIGLATCIVFALSFLVMKFRKSTSAGVDTVRHRREAIVTKRLVQLLLVKAVIQIIPSAIYIYARELTLWEIIKTYVWILQGLNQSVFAAAYVCIDSTFRKEMKKIFTCRTHVISMNHDIASSKVNPSAESHKC